MRSLSPFWQALHNKSPALVGKLSKMMSYKLKNSPDYSFTMMWSFSITNELSIKIKTTLSSLSSLEYTFLCKRAVRIRSWFPFLSLFPLLYPNGWKEKKKKKQKTPQEKNQTNPETKKTQNKQTNPHNSQCRNKGYVFMIIFYFTNFKELLPHRQNKSSS